MIEKRNSRSRKAAQKAPELSYADWLAAMDGEVETAYASLAKAAETQPESKAENPQPETTNRLLWLCSSRNQALEITQRIDGMIRKELRRLRRIEDART